MKNIQLSAKDWKNPDNVWDAFLKCIGAPDWHGRNLDALSESISANDINELKPPYSIVISDVQEIPKSVVFRNRPFSGVLASET